MLPNSQTGSLVAHLIHIHIHRKSDNQYLKCSFPVVEFVFVKLTLCVLFVHLKMPVPYKIQVEHIPVELRSEGLVRFRSPKDQHAKKNVSIKNVHYFVLPL